MTSHEAFTGNKPSVAHLRSFGCKAHVHIPDEKHQKLGAKSLECINLGYAEHKKAYVCLHCATGRIFKSQDIVFDEGDPEGPSRVKIDTAPLEGDPEGSKCVKNDNTSISKHAASDLQAPDGQIHADESPHEDTFELDLQAGQEDAEDSSSEGSDDNSHQYRPPFTRRYPEGRTNQLVKHVPAARRQTNQLVAPPAPYPHPIPPPEV